MDAYGTYTAVVQEQVDGQDNGHNWQNNLTGETKFSFNPEKMILDVQKDTGVEGIEADENAEAVYYNLQGVRVNNPENGLYIRVQGNSPPVPPCPSASVFK